MQLEELKFHATLIPPATAAGMRKALEGVDPADRVAVEEALDQYDDQRIAAAEAVGQTLPTAEWRGREIKWDQA
ncbi:hypothetical protein [Amycolatopsis sp. NPDC051102]|uniref:hypothetical protein n=1 Tax=Amycolatopsis sp. NPDC051102 TaxID=3155163 RepID=UPI00341381E2